MDVVIDVQGYRGYYGRFIAKEIAIMDLKGDFVAHWILESRISLKFPEKYRKEYQWINTYHHKIKWTDGKSKFRRVIECLRDVIYKSDRVFVRGSCKAEFLKRYTEKEVIDLNEQQDECPSFRKMNKSDVICNYHSTMKDSNPTKHINCALTQVHQLRDWITENSSIEEWFDVEA